MEEGEDADTLQQQEIHRDAMKMKYRTNLIKSERLGGTALHSRRGGGQCALNACHTVARIQCKS